jgi:hypothetical protein
MEKKITQFKNGDIIVGDNGCCSYITIFKSHRDPSSFNHYASYTSRGYFQINGYASSLNLRFATEDERQILFKQLRLNGYQWNEENKTLIDWNIPRFKVGDRIRSIKNPNEEYTITAIYKFAYNCKNDIYTDFTIYIKRQTDWELVPNKNMRTQETQEQKDNAISLLRNILTSICEATSDIEEVETDLGLCVIPNFRYEPVFEFTEDDLKLIKSLQDSEGIYDFSQLIK